MISTILPADTVTANPFFNRELPARPVADTTMNFQSIVFPEPVKLPSFFKGHQLQPIHHGPVPVNTYSDSWIMGVFLLSFILLAWVNVFFHNRFRQILAAPFSRRFMNQLSREGDLFSERITMALSIIYLLIFSLLLFEIYSLFLKPRVSFPFPDFHLYLLILGGLTLYWILKITAIRILGSIFRTYQTSDAYIQNVLVAIFQTAVVLLPLMLFIVYLRSPVLLYTAAGLFALIFFLQFIKGFLIGISLTRFSYFYLFVYLCSLEILPWLVLVKVFMIRYF
ncbi:MAG: DUF4271 domain-containing protein [Syntrophothermus sp.]